MPDIQIFEPNQERFVTYSLEEEQQMPFVERLPFTVGDFLRLSGTAYAWTDQRALSSLDRLAENAGIYFSVDQSFRKAGDAGGDPHGLLHGAGVAFDVGKNLTWEKRESLRREAVACGGFSSVSMAYRGGDTVHLSCRPLPACLHREAQGVFVFLLQQILMDAELYHGPLSGRFDRETLRGVRRAVRRLALAGEDEIFRGDWRNLLTLTNPSSDAKIEKKLQ